MSTPIFTCRYVPYPVRFVSHVPDGYDACFDGQSILIERKAATRSRLLDILCGWNTRVWKEHITGRDCKYLDWPDGLWIGERQVEVQLVRRFVKSHGWHLDYSDNLILIQSCTDTAALIDRIGKACDAFWGEWRGRTLRRRLKREHAIVRFNPQPESKPHRKKIAMAPERLSPKENKELEADAEAAMKKIMGHESNGAAEEGRAA